MKYNFVATCNLTPLLKDSSIEKFNSCSNKYLVVQIIIVINLKSLLLKMEIIIQNLATVCSAGALTRTVTGSVGSSDGYYKLQYERHHNCWIRWIVEPNSIQLNYQDT